MKCHCCGDATEHLYTVRGFSIGRCVSCGHGQVLDPPSDPTAIYGEGYFEGGMDDGYAAYGATEPVLRREFRRTLARLRKFVPDGRLVEIGCAYGVFLDLARTHFEVTGVEVSESAASRARERGLRVHASIDALEGTFDAAVMLDVIEHLGDPGAILSTLRSRVKSGLVITTGDFSSVLARAMRSKWRLMTPPQHLHFFTKRSLAKLLERTGWRALEMTRPMKLVPLKLAIYQLGLPAERIPASFGVPVNLFDTVRVIAR